MLNILILINLFLILLSLAFGLVFLGQSKKEARTRLLGSLTARITLSFSLIALLIFAYLSGDITPNQVPALKAPIKIQEAPS